MKDFIGELYDGDAILMRDMIAWRWIEPRLYPQPNYGVLVYGDPKGVVDAGYEFADALMARWDESELQPDSEDASQEVEEGAADRGP